MPQILSYDVMGSKESFADWISDISPYDTPFVSLTGKAPVYNRIFEWQYDRLNNVTDNAWSPDPSDMPEPIQKPTIPVFNYTQILRKVCQVSDTAQALDSYGRGKELEYQIEKASKEIKRDLEKVLLSNQLKTEGDETNPRMMDGFYNLVAGVNEPDPDTKAVVHKKLPSTIFTEDDLFDITQNLYMAGSRANTIMFHPTYTKIFSKMIEKDHGREILFDHTDELYARELLQITDPLGQKYDLLPNRNMDKGIIFIFHPHDWFQRILRAPTVSYLDKTGSNENWMLEMELGLQHRHPWGSGILELSDYTGGISYSISLNSIPAITAGSTPVQLTYVSKPAQPVSVTWDSSNKSIATVSDTGLFTPLAEGSTNITVSATYPFGPVQTSTISVTVNPIIYSIVINPYSSPKEGDDPIQMTAKGSPVEPSKKVWSVTSGDSVTITPDGLMTIVKNGISIIKVVGTFPSGDKQAITNVSVTANKYVKLVDLDDVKVGEDITLDYDTNILDSDMDVVSWASDDPTIAKVKDADNGIFTGVKVGSVEVKCSIILKNTNTTVIGTATLNVVAP